MESIPNSIEQQGLISSFLEITASQSADTASQFLQATSWKLEEALQLFYIGNEGGGQPSASLPPPVLENHISRENAVLNETVSQDVEDDGIRAPLPVKREILYGDPSLIRLRPSSVVAFRNFEEESKQPAVWESDQSQSSALTENSSRDNLASLYRPPFSIMYTGPFDKAKIEASLQAKWLLINLQSTEEFSSHMLNRDTWSNEAVTQTILTNFIFWQVYHDTSEGKKVCTYYKLDSIPAILVIDPITGQKMRAWTGMIPPERLLEDLLPFMDRGPKEHHVLLPHKRPRESVEKSMVKMSVGASEEEDVRRAVAASMEDVKGSIRSPTTNDEPERNEDEETRKEDAETSLNVMPTYPPLSEEPRGSRELLSRVGIRLPDGRRLQRNFLRTDPIKLLWSFCFPLVEEENRPFHFTLAIPGASKKSLDYESDLSFEEAGLSSSMISLTWD